MLATGIVYLIGAGPGNPKLITLRGLECLRRADVVVYDRLGTSQLLREVRPDAEMIYVGKAAGDHALKQEEINLLLAEKASEGKVVARLKGGDPFVFGRGGEEAFVLQERGIPFEIVPGVTSSIAAPAHAGIPVTHRNVASSFAVVTGHEHPSKSKSAIDWAGLAKATDTVVFLMGLGNLSMIVKQLLEFGRAPETPVALVSSGSCPNQKTVTGTLATIEAVVAAQEVPSPAVIVVGDVVKLREKLAWFDNKPLFGRRIAVVRSLGQGAETARMVERFGGEPVEVISVPADPADVTAPERFEAGQVIVCRSVAGVDRLFGRLYAQGLDSRALAGVRIVSLDVRATDALWARGVRPDYTHDRQALLNEIMGEQGIGWIIFNDGSAVGAWADLLGDMDAPEATIAAADERTATAVMGRGFGLDMVAVSPDTIVHEMVSEARRNFKLNARAKRHAI